MFISQINLIKISIGSILNYKTWGSLINNLVKDCELMIKNFK